jgi:predicted protein tyrosine phosphatase
MRLAWKPGRDHFGRQISARRIVCPDIPGYWAGMQATILLPCLQNGHAKVVLFDLQEFEL